MEIDLILFSDTHLLLLFVNDNNESKLQHIVRCIPGVLPATREENKMNVLHFTSVHFTSLLSPSSSLLVVQQQQQQQEEEEESNSFMNDFFQK